jgi:serine/threonine protein kinase
MSDFSQDLGASIRPGHRVGAYTVVGEVGSGGMATVFRATSERGETVALKVLHPASVMPEEVKRFTREYETLSSEHRACARNRYGRPVPVHRDGVRRGQ